MLRFKALADALVEVADTLVADYDVVELGQQLVDSAVIVLPIDAAGILLGDPRGHLRAPAGGSSAPAVLTRPQVFAATGEQTRLLGGAEDGPCVRAFTTGEAVMVDDLGVDQERWPEFAETALRYGVRAVSALPMRLRDERIGALALFRAKAGAMSDSDVAVGQSLADMATIGILHHRAVTDSDALSEQLQTAFSTRVIIEQAKAKLAERGSTNVDRAYALLRAHARYTNQRLSALASAVVDGGDATLILNPAPVAARDRRRA